MSDDEDMPLLDDDLTGVDWKNSMRSGGCHVPEGERFYAMKVKIVCRVYGSSREEAVRLLKERAAERQSRLKDRARRHDAYRASRCPW